MIKVFTKYEQVNETSVKPTPPHEQTFHSKVIFSLCLNRSISHCLFWKTLTPSFYYMINSTEQFQYSSILKQTNE